MKVSIVIPTWNHLSDCLEPCLESIKKHTNLKDIEVLVVANGCTDNTKEYVEGLGKPFKLLWYKKPLGFPKATNKGIAKAKGDYVLLLNNDTIIQGADWIDRLLEPFKDKKVKLTGAHKLCNHVTREFIVGWCMMIDRTVFKELGTLNEDYGWGAGEDIEFSWKIEDAGYKWVQVDIPVKHLGEQTVHDNNPELTREDWDKTFWENMKKVNQLSRKISIIIPTYNHLEDCLKPCLESIKEYTDLGAIEVIVVSNGSTDGTQEYVKGLGSPFKLLDYPEPLGYTKATNLGIREATGEFLILLNNDTVLLPQAKNDWINKLHKPFIDSKVGITGPLLNHSPSAGRDFLVFFCVMLRKSVMEDVGYLDEVFSPGAGEDTDWCIKAIGKGYKMVVIPEGSETKIAGGLVVGDFPIYHAGEATVSEIPNWNEIIEKNEATLSERYNPDWKKLKLSNSYERAVFYKDDTLFPRERTRYEWARDNMTGKKVLELGCSNGYGQMVLPKGIDYTGYDYDQPILDNAKEQFPQGKYKKFDLEKEKIKGHWDTIIAMEVLEHLDNGVELAQELKKHCDTLLCTVPYDEPVGFWGGHHKKHGLSEKDFPDFEYKFIDFEGNLVDKPGRPFNVTVKGEDYMKTESLMLMKWTK